VGPEALDYVTLRLGGYRGDEFGTLCSAKATNEEVTSIGV
jgi:predicted molibdopterin-dependent oxidoreductase YjgC